MFSVFYSNYRSHFHDFTLSFFRFFSDRTTPPNVQRIISIVNVYFGLFPHPSQLKMSTHLKEVSQFIDLTYLLLLPKIWSPYSKYSLSPQDYAKIVRSVQNTLEINRLRALSNIEIEEVTLNVYIAIEKALENTSKTKEEFSNKLNLCLNINLMGYTNSWIDYRSMLRNLDIKPITTLLNLSRRVFLSASVFFKALWVLQEWKILDFKSIVRERNVLGNLTLISLVFFHFLEAVEAYHKTKTLASGERNYIAWSVLPSCANVALYGAPLLVGSLKFTRFLAIYVKGFDFYFNIRRF